MDKNKKIKTVKNKKRGVGKKRVLAMVCAAAVALLFLFTCFYDVIRANASAVDDAKAARDKAKEELEAIKDQKSDLVEEYARFDKELTALEDEIAALENSIENTKREISRKEVELADAEANTEEYKTQFKNRARVMYENGSASYLEVLLGAESFSDLLDRVEIVGSIMDYDREVLEQYVKSQDVIKNARTEKQSLLDEQLQEEESLAYREEQLNILLEKQQVMIDQLSKDEAAANKVYTEAEKKYEEEERKAQEEIRRQLAQSGNIYYNSNYTGGKFAWPVPSSGRITSPFGYRNHPISHVNKLHRGIDIGASYGAAVVAAEEGVVIVAGYNSSYGRYVVINHGNGYTTLYAHNSALLVSVGQTVSRGQQIAKAGSTGNSTGPHCHFEVSYNGALQNPLNYLQ